MSLTIADHCRSMLTEKLMPFRVLMSCGHVERRLMREMLAGQAYSEDALITAGAGCTHCDRSKQSLHRSESCFVCAGLTEEPLTDSMRARIAGREE